MTTREEVLKYCLSFPDTYQDGTVPMEEIQRMIAESYDLVSTREPKQA